MTGRPVARRIAYLVWALLLAGALSFSSAQAEALHGDCGDTCLNNCGEGNCSRAVDLGCTCYWRCTNGSSGKAVCVL